MDSEYLEAAVQRMHDRGVAFSKGMRPKELEAVEATLGFQFPPDLRAFLAHALPQGANFPNWRDLDSPALTRRISAPAEGMCFDMEHNDFWLPAWGSKPESMILARSKIREDVRAGPFLIPVYGHGYLPAEPCEAGNPVFSIFRSDIRYYGYDLPAYLEAEFGVRNPFDAPLAPREIALWGELERGRG